MTGITSPPGLVELIGKQTAANVAAIDFSWVGKVYSKVGLIVNAALPADDDVEAWLLMSDDGGVSFEAGTSDYRWAHRFGTTAAEEGGTADSADGSIVMTRNSIQDAVGSAAGEGWWGKIELIMPAQATSTAALFHGNYEDSLGNQVWINGIGHFIAVDVVEAIRFTFEETSNIISGEFACYGLK